MNQPKQSINLMPQIKMRSANLFQSITEVPVVLSANIQDGDCYKISARKVGDDWENLYALTAVGLSKLMTAAGIQAIPEWNHPIEYDQNQPYMINWNFGILWIQPDGVELRHAASYLLDLRDWIETSSGRVRGPRFDQSWQKVRLDTLARWAKKDGKKVPTDSDEKTIALLEYEEGLDTEKRGKLEKYCNEKAYQAMVDMRVHIERRAQTGAMDAALRKLLKLKSGYTAAELQQGFTVYRTHFDRAAMLEILGPEMTQNLALAAAAKALGVSIEDVRLALPEPSTKSPLAQGTNGDNVVIIPSSDDHPPADTPLSESEVINNDEAVAEEPHELVALLWNSDYKVDPVELLDAKRDEALISRAGKLLAPKQHVANHLKKYYNVDRWGQMMVAQGLELWAHLNSIEFPAEQVVTDEKSDDASVTIVG